MPRHEGFLQDILANPEDDTPRLVYADWLSEHDEPERAEFVRLQCRLATLPETDPTRPSLLARERELLQRHELAWLGPLLPLLFEGDLPSDDLHAPLLSRAWHFERGLVERVAVPLATFLEQADLLFHITPVRWVWFAFNQEEGEDICGEDHVRLARCPQLARLTTLDLSGHQFESPASGTNRLLRSPHLTRLRRLYLRYGFGMDDVGFVDPSTVRLLASGKHLPALRLLDLGLNEWGDEYAKILRRAKGFQNLESLSLRGVYLTGEGSEALAQARCLAGLHELDLSLNDIGDRGALALSRSPHLSRLRRLVVSCQPSTQEPEDRMTKAGSQALRQHFGAAVSFDD